MLEAQKTLNWRQLIWWLVGFALVGGLALVLITSDTAPAVTFGEFSTRFLGIFIEAAPFLLLGTAVSGLIEVFVTREDIVRWVPKNPVLATLTGTFLGFAFPVCECGVVPVTRRLFTKGLPMSVGVAFLLAAPVMNPIVLVSTYIAFGFGPMLIGRFVVTALVALAVGMVVALSARPQDILIPASFAPVSGGSGELPNSDVRVYASGITPRVTLQQKLYSAFRIGSDEFFDMGRYLVIGSMAAALLQTAVAQETLITIGEGPLISVLAMQLLAFVLSVCSTVDSFLALAFTGTFTSGSILAFLTFGPMVDIKSMLMFMGVFKPRTVLHLIILPLLMTLLIGVWVNLLGLF